MGCRYGPVAVAGLHHWAAASFVILQFSDRFEMRFLTYDALGATHADLSQQGTEGDAQ